MNKIKLTYNEFISIPKQNKNGIYVIDDCNIQYHVDGELHREDGPALIYIDGLNVYNSWYINGKKFYEEDYNIQVYLIKNNLVNYE